MGRRIPFPSWRSARVDRLEGKVRVTTAPKRPVPSWGVFVAALVAWVFGGVSAGQGLLDPTQISRRGWIAGWLLFWTVWGAYAFARSFVLAVGRERVEVDARFIVLRRDVAGIGRSQTYELSRLRNLHHAPPPPVVIPTPPTRGWPPPPTPLLAGSIRFEYGKRTHEFALGIDWPDMGLVLEALRERVPIASTASADE